jgi:hypothetical protein
VLLLVRRPLVAICGYGTDNAGFVGKIQTAKLAVLLDRLTPFFEDCAALVMNLMRRSKPFGGRFDLRGAAYPHIHRQPKNRVGRELVQVYVEILEDIDDDGMKGEPESRE